MTQPRSAGNPNPPAPAPQEPNQSWEHYALYTRVRETLFSLPSYFKPDTHISGLQATDIFALNSALGAAIEAQAVEALNDLRSTWDPDQQYARFSFVRQPQTFPDVRLQRFRADEQPEIILGVELKGWYILAKEAEPSFRMVASPDACAPADLIAIYPWVLNNVISGRPQLFRPFVVPAKYAAEVRNHHWRYRMAGRGDRSLVLAAGAAPYPAKADTISDHATNDSGGNFGRLARTEIMDEYKAAISQEPVAGIPAAHWRTFLKAFVSGQDENQIEAAINRLVRTVTPPPNSLTDDQVEQIADHLRAIAEIISPPQ